MSDLVGNDPLFEMFEPDERPVFEWFIPDDPLGVVPLTLISSDGFTLVSSDGFTLTARG